MYAIPNSKDPTASKQLTIVGRSFVASSEVKIRFYATPAAGAAANNPVVVAASTTAAPDPYFRFPVVPPGFRSGWPLSLDAPNSRLIFLAGPEPLDVHGLAVGDCLTGLDLFVQTVPSAALASLQISVKQLAGSIQLPFTGAELKFQRQPLQPWDLQAGQWNYFPFSSPFCPVQASSFMGILIEAVYDSSSDAASAQGGSFAMRHTLRGAGYRWSGDLTQGEPAPEDYIVRFRCSALVQHALHYRSC